MWVDIPMIRSTECYFTQGQIYKGEGEYGHALLRII